MRRAPIRTTSKKEGITLAEAIRLGCNYTTPVHNQYFQYIDENECGTCAIGAAIVGALYPTYSLQQIAAECSLLTALDLFPELDANNMKLADHLIGLYDCDGVTREEIADRLEAGTIYV